MAASSRQFERLIACAAALVATDAAAQLGRVTLDGSAGPAGTLNGPNFAITSGLGTTRGANLFHSFGEFNLSQGQKATFSNPASVSNIIARVISPGYSVIDGTIATRLEAGGIPTQLPSAAALWLINPRGMVFGPHAVLETSGSFHVSTADYLRLGQGPGAKAFYASLHPGSRFSSAAPSAFGFVNPNPSAFVGFAGSRLALAQGRSLSLVGGEVILVPDSLGRSAVLSAPGGRINVASAAGPGEIAIGGDGLTTDPGQALGNVGAFGSELSVTAANANSGSIQVRAGRLELRSGGNLDVGSYSGAGDAGVADLRATDSIRIDGVDGTGISSGVYASSHGSGRGGTIAIAAPSVSVTDSGTVQAKAFGSGAAGTIGIEGDRLEVRSAGRIDAGSRSGANGGSVSVMANEWIAVDAAGTNQTTGILSRAEAAGNAGTVVVSAPLFTVRNGGAVAAYTTAAGNAGALDVEAGTIELLAGGQLSASALKDASGHGGTVRVTASEAIVADGQSAIAFSGIFANTLGSGDAGTVTVTGAPRLTLSNGAMIAASSVSGGNSGAVSVTAGSLDLSAGGRIEAAAYGNGAAGNVTVHASGPIRIDGLAGSLLFTGIAADTYGPGRAGDVLVTAPHLGIVNGGAVSSATFASGDAGNVTVAVGTLSLRSGSWIMSGRIAGDGIAATGAGGRVEVRATQSILVDGIHPAPGLAVVHSNIFAGTGGAGAGGDVVVSAPAITLSNGGAVQSFSTGTGAAGAVTVNAGRLELAAGGSIDTSGSDEGAGGRITVNATGRVAIHGSGADGLPSSISADTGGSAPAGDIAISTGQLVLSDGGMIRGTTIGTGAAGSIRIAAGSVEMHDRAVISVQSSDGPVGGPAVAGGAAGSITIDAGSRLEMSGASRINARTESAPAGDIRIRASELVFLSGSEISTSVAGGQGNGGNIAIDPTFVVLDASRIVANALRGAGGNISIVSDFFFNSDSIVQAASELGISGTVQISSPNQNVNPATTVLPAAYFDASSLLRPSCAARAAGGGTNSFTGAGRGGIAAGPGALVAADAPSGARPAISAQDGMQLAAAGGTPQGCSQ